MRGAPGKGARTGSPFSPVGLAQRPGCPPAIRRPTRPPARHPPRRHPIFRMSITGIHRPRPARDSLRRRVVFLEGTWARIWTRYPFSTSEFDRRTYFCLGDPKVDRRLVSTHRSPVEETKGTKRRKGGSPCASRRTEPYRAWLVQAGRPQRALLVPVRSLPGVFRGRGPDPDPPPPGAWIRPPFSTSRHDPADHVGPFENGSAAKPGAVKPV